MLRYEKKVVQTPKITARGILLHIAFFILLIIGASLVSDHIESSAISNLIIIFVVVADAICILHLVHRLVLNKVWFDVNDPDYRTEYIELYNDHIVIFDRAQTYSGHHYSYAVIYFEDIKYTFIHNKKPKAVYKMLILLNRNLSGKTLIKKEGGKTNSFFTYMRGYPEELSYLLFTKYKNAMKVR